MTTTEQVLLIILSTFLALFLLLSIIALIQVLVLVGKVRRMVDKAEKVVASAETVGGFFRKAAGPVTVMRLMKSIADLAQHKEKKEK